MSESRSGAGISRRMLAVSAGALLGLGAVGGWLRWGRGPGGVASLSHLANAPALKVVGQAYLTATSVALVDVEAVLRTRLASGSLDEAIEADYAKGRLVAVDGWFISESQALAGAWLALQQQG